MKGQKKFGVISLGCDKNRVDSEKCIAVLQSAGYKLTNDVREAQIAVINTCAFLQSAREESVETVIETAGYKSENLEKIVVTGCLPQKYAAEVFPALTEGDVFLGINDYDLLPSALETAYETGERVNLVGKGADTFRFARTLTTAPYLAYLKIADGCYNHCTYCLIPKIRGKYRSYPIENLLEEAKELGEVKELVLVAQDTTRYGEDLYGENRFPQLIRALSKLENTAATFRKPYSETHEPARHARRVSRAHKKAEKRDPRHRAPLYVYFGFPFGNGRRVRSDESVFEGSGTFQLRLFRVFARTGHRRRENGRAGALSNERTARARLIRNAAAGFAKTFVRVRR